MGFEPYLCVNGQEVANAMRTLTYVRRGLAGTGFEVGLQSVLVPGSNPHSEVIGDTYSDTYGDIYGGEIVTVYDGDEYTAENLACYCSAVDEGPYVSPEDDEAPWWLASRPESGDYLGIWIRSITVDPVAVRSLTPRRGFGSRLGNLNPRHRTLAVDGLMFAASAEGMAWGERWLSDVLSGALCSDDETMEATVLPACPDLVDEDSAFRVLEEVGIIDGPAFSPVEGARQCHVQRVAFQLAAGVPHLLGEATACVDAVSLEPVSSALGCLVEAPEWVGDVAVRVTIEALLDLQNVEVWATPLHPDQTDCPIVGTPSPAVRYVLPAIEEGDVVTIDATRRAIWRDNATTKSRESGVPLLDLDGPIGWIEVPPCSRVCVTVFGTGAGTVTVETIPREL